MKTYVKSGIVKFNIILLVTISCLVACATQEQRNKDDEAQISRARAHTNLGAVYFRQKQFEIALEEFTEAVQIYPDFAMAHNGLGLVHAVLGEDGIADGDFRKSIQLEPNNSESHNNYGSFLCARARYDESIKEFLAAVKNPLYATPAVAYTNAGICSMRNKDNVSAEGYFTKALQIDPLLSVPAYQLALMQFNRKDAVAAKITLQNVLLAQSSPEMLWLAVQIERVVGAKDAEASYALQLRNQYPDSKEAKLLLTGN